MGAGGEGDKISSGLDAGWRHAGRCTSPAARSIVCAFQVYVLRGVIMECGTQDVFCHVMTWLTENELAASGLAELLGRLGQSASGVVGAVAQILKDYGQAIVGLLGFTFGFWRWWRYREHILHKRLAEYIGEKDARLKDARAQVLETIQRPAPGQEFKAPLFINWELRSVLRERNWDNTVLALTVESSADWQLSGAIESIKRKLRTAEDEAASLKQQLCTAYSMRGAIASSISREDKSSIALSHFRSALSLPGHEGDVVVKELEAHQLRKLGHFQSAKWAYARVLELAETVQPSRDRQIIKARARRYLAEIESLTSRFNAYCMMTAAIEGDQSSPGALALLNNCQPLSAWELVEKGDMHYFTAYLANKLTYPVVEPSQLDEALTAYQNASLSVRKKPWQIATSSRRLGKRIREGQRRVTDAVQTATYDYGVALSRLTAAAADNRQCKRHRRQLGHFQSCEAPRRARLL